MSLFSFTPMLNDEPADTTLQFDEIVVTASKIPLAERETTKPVIVIPRAEIERSGSRDLSQLLQNQSGIRVNQAYGAPGENRTMFMQGAGNRYTLFLIDGLAVNDPSAISRVFDMRMIPLESVERVEILKGSQSTLYGTDAVAGVVNVITRRDATKPVELNGNLSYGSYNTFNGSIGANGRLNEMTSYRFHASTETTDGFSAASEPEDSAESFDPDGFTRTAFRGTVEFTPLPSLTISPFIHYSTFDGEFDAAAFQDADNRIIMDMVNPGATLRYETGNLQLFSGYNYTYTDRVFRYELFDDSEFTGKMHNSDTYAIYAFSPNLNLLAGFNVQQNTLPSVIDDDGEVVVDSVDDTIYSPYATLLLKGMNGLNAELGVRLNSHSEYGENTTFSIAPSWNLTEQVKLYASFGTGFTTPTLDELFGPFGPNPELDPERSRYLNAGIEFYGASQRLKFSAQYFNRRIDDVIVFTTQYENRDHQDDSGIELQANWLAGRSLSLGGYYNYVTGELTSVDAGGEETVTSGLLRRPKHSIGASAGYNITPELLVRLQGEFNSDREDVFFNPVTFEQKERTLGSYTLFNLYAEYALTGNRVRVYSDIRNLFNTGFTEVYGFNTMGFNAVFGARFGF